MGLSLYFRSWWSRHYNRPMKDPILATYTIEELAYEYYDKIERAEFAEEQSEEETDKIEEAKYDDAIKWAEEEEAKEIAEAAPEEGKENPELTPDDKAWMEEQLRAEREVRGDDAFGGDISEEF